MPAECLRGRKEDLTVKQRLAAGIALAVMLTACSSGAPGATVPGVSQPPGATAGATNPPAATPGNPQPAGNLEAAARALVPPGSVELSEAQYGNAYQLNVTTTMSLDQLKAFWAQAIPATGATSPGQFESGGILTVTLNNPEGGIVASPDATSGGYLITISLGTSQ